ncbi:MULTISPECIES: PHP domain-containing protein [unclassified Streptomyces]|uniref:PHP domain-containing protein n=1 Tax=Streptomyces TaxID=1883 RepID=UPI0019059502|nr:MULTISPECIES: PHP domain-containing protein [unclassified Streptomyces]MCU4745383.1 PHP domain-containing protein [Streptomyces sp. G-5]QQN79607.1 PHP domain-containing protein [Streptomyces sp. XC 2026]
MGHGHHHPHGHDHEHGHGHDHDHDGEPRALPAAMDTEIPDSELSPDQLSRRSMLRRAGLLGAGIAGAGVLGSSAFEAAAAAPGTRPTGNNGRGNGNGNGRMLWLAGDHHIHTQYSSDGLYRVSDQVRNGARHGLDWMVITDHGSTNHSRIGVEKVNPDIKAARERYQDTLVFQGLEWNIPAAEHATVFVHPGKNEVDVLKQFETGYDGAVKGATADTPQNEALAISGLNFLAEQVQRKKVKAALMLANHPSRKGIDSPHEIRAWRDAQPGIAVGMEGAPGHQAAGIAKPGGPGSGRGYYDSSPGAGSFPAYPAESYRTWGGFDWMTATVGGLWDSLLAEGKPWWISANSDSHSNYADTAARPADTDFDANGFHGDPVYSGGLNLDAGDYWPGQYSRTHVGATNFSYAAVMEGIRDGRVWVDHGGLISGLDAQLRGGNRSATLGGTLQVKRGTSVELRLEIALANGANWAGFVPELARVDVIRGEVTGAAQDRDGFRAPGTKVAQSFEVNKSTGSVTLIYKLGKVDRPVYVRVRGTDGNRSQVGLHGAATDPNGPALDVVGDADPWRDLWFYSNPIWVLPS